MRRKISSCTLLVGRYTGTAFMKISMEGPQKLKIELSYDPAIPLLDVYSIHSFKFSGPLVLIFETELFIELKDMEFSFDSVKI